MYNIDIEARYEEELKKFGKNIKRIRILKGFSTQKEFGIACSIGRTQISRIENASVNVEFDTIVRLAAGLRLQLVSLFDYSVDFRPTSFEEAISIERRLEMEKQKLGAKLLKLREQNQMIQLDVDAGTGIERSKISEYENRLTNIEFRTLVKFLPALQVEMVDLFRYDNT